MKQLWQSDNFGLYIHFMMGVVYAVLLKCINVLFFERDLIMYTRESIGKINYLQSNDSI